MIRIIPNTNIYVDDEDKRLYMEFYDHRLKIKYLKDVTHSLPNNDGNVGIHIRTCYVLKDIEWYINLSIHNINLPIEHNNRYKDIVFVKANHHGVAKKHGYEYLPILDNPITIYINNVEFRLVLISSDYCISNNGVLYNLKKKVYVKELNNDDYPYIRYSIRLPYRNNINTTITKHKLVALCWCHNDDYVNKCVVDHIDNNKFNNHYTNLNWVTASENRSKFNFGSKDSNFIIRNIETKEVKYFNSLKSVSEYLDRYRIDVTRQPLKYGKVWKTNKGCYEIYKVTDFKKWLHNTIPDIKKYSYEIIDNGIHTKYSNLTEIRNKYGLRTKYNNKEVTSYNIVNVIKNVCGKNIKLIPLLNSFKNGIEIYNLQTNESKLYNGKDALKNICLEYGCNRNVVYNRLTHKFDNKPILGKYLVRAKTNEPWRTDIIKQSNLAKQIIAINTKDETDIINYNSIYEIYKITKLDYKTIYKFIDKNLPVEIDGINRILKLN